MLHASCIQRSMFSVRRSMFPFPFFVAVLSHPLWDILFHPGLESSEHRCKRRRAIKARRGGAILC
jgi:hypothetical protein